MTVLAAEEPPERVVDSALRDWNVIRVPFFHPRREEWSAFRRLVSSEVPGFSAINTNLLREAILREWVTNGPYDVMYFVTQLPASVLPLVRAKCRIVIDAYDYYAAIHALRRRQVPFYRPYYWIYLKEGIMSAKAEHRVLRLATVILVPTADEAVALRGSISGPAIHVLPNGASVPEVQWNAGGLTSVLMVANYDYEPNREGLRWFMEHVWLQVLNEHPTASLRVVGKGSNKLDLEDTPGVRQIGQVVDLSHEYLNSACCVIPVLSGGGSRLKLLEAMAYGIPIVSTTFGASGIEHENTVSIADTPNAFAVAVSACLQNDRILLDRATRAREVIAKNYTWDSIGQKLRAILSA